MKKILHLTWGYGGELIIVKGLNDYINSHSEKYSSEYISLLKTKHRIKSFNGYKILGEVILSPISLLKLISSILNVDIVMNHCYYNFSSVFISTLVKLLGKKLVIMTHVNPYNFGSARLRLFYDIRRYIVWNIGLILANQITFITNNHNKQYERFAFIKSLHRKKSNDIGGNFINSSFYQGGHSHKYDGSSLKVVFVGRFEKNKGYYDILELAKIIDKRITFTLIGDYIETFDKQISIIGFVPNEQLKELLDRHDIFFLPTYTETFPISIIEAMSRGLPIVTTPVDALPEMIKDQVNGFLVEAGNIVQMKNLFETLLNKDTILEDMSRENLLYSQNFKDSVICQRHIAVFDKL